MGEPIGSKRSIINASYTNLTTARGLGSGMSRYIITAALICLCSVAAASQPIVHPTLQPPAALPPTSGSANASMLDNPFLPKPDRAGSSGSPAPSSASAEHTLPPLDLEKAFVLRAFMEYGTKVGTINGKTVFRLKNHYLFVKTNSLVQELNIPRSILQEQELPPPIPSAARVGGTARPSPIKAHRHLRFERQKP